MLSLLFIVAIISGLIFGKSKIVQIYQFLVSLITFSFATNIPDYIGYLLCYESASVQNTSQVYLDAFEPGYRISNYLFSDLGLNYDQFRIIIFSVCYLLIMSTIKRYSGKQNIVYSLYMIFPFCMDCIQIRNFIGTAILIFSLRYLFDSDKQIIKYIVGCLFASFFQSTMIVYLLFSISIFDKKSFNLIYRALFIVIFILCAVQFFIGIPLLRNISYFSSKTSVFTYGSFFVILYLVYHFSHKIDALYKKIDFVSRLGNENIIKFTKLILLFAPFLIFHSDFFRWIRNILIVFSIIVIEYLTYNNVITWRKLKLGFIVVFIFCILLYRFAYIGQDNSFIDLLLKNNLLFTD